MKNSILRALTLLVCASGAWANVADGPWVLTTDYQNFGNIEALDAGSPWTPSGELGPVHSDSVARWHNGKVYLVGRGSANHIQVYDPANGWNLDLEFSIGIGRNPQDIAFPGDGTAWVSCYDEAVLLKVSLADGSIITTFDTSMYADDDGRPETSWMHLHEDLLYITCQLLDTNGWFNPTAPGKLLVMNVATGQWQDPIQLEVMNPYTHLRMDADGTLLVGGVGNWALADGGVERVNLTTQSSEGLVLTEAQLGGDLLNFIVDRSGRYFVLTSSPSFATTLLAIDADGSNQNIVESREDFDLVDLAWDGDFQLLVADRNLLNPGIRVYDTHNETELTTAPVTLGLPPFMIVFAGITAASPVPFIPASLGPLSLAAPFPNPCNPASDLVVNDRPGQEVQVSVFDLRGHKVAQSRVTTDSNGTATYRFNGQTALGAPMSAGVYRVVAQSPGGYAARTVTLVK